MTVVSDPQAIPSRFIGGTSAQERSQILTISFCEDLEVLTFHDIVVVY